MFPHGHDQVTKNDPARNGIIWKWNCAARGLHPFVDGPHLSERSRLQTSSRDKHEATCGRCAPCARIGRFGVRQQHPNQHSTHGGKRHLASRAGGWKRRGLHTEFCHDIFRKWRFQPGRDRHSIYYGWALFRRGEYSGRIAKCVEFNWRGHGPLFLQRAVGNGKHSHSRWDRERDGYHWNVDAERKRRLRRLG